MMSYLHCPPVWGYIGLEKYVDINRTVYHSRGGLTGVVEDGVTSIGVFNHSVTAQETEETHKYLHSVYLRSGDLAEKIVLGDCDKPVSESSYHCGNIPSIGDAV